MSDFTIETADHVPAGWRGYTMQWPGVRLAQLTGRWYAEGRRTPVGMWHDYREADGARIRKLLDVGVWLFITPVLDRDHFFTTGEIVDDYLWELVRVGDEDALACGVLGTLREAMAMADLHAGLLD